MHLILVVSKRKVLVIPEVRDYTTTVVYKKSLIDFRSVNNLTLIISKCYDVILSKFKVVKFTTE